MLSSMRTFLLFLALATTGFVYSLSLEALYGSLLGNQNASTFYQNLVRQALRDHGVKNPEALPIKKMNGVAPTVMKLQLYSFTTHGIWLNEELLNRVSPAERIFIMYHEAAHVKNRDHKTILFRLIPSSTLWAAGLALSYYATKTKLAFLGSIAAATALVGVSTYKLLLQPLVQQQEKDADLSALTILYKHGHLTTIDEYLQQLEKYASADHQNDSPWHSSNKEQLHYLQHHYAKLCAETAQ